MCMKKIVQKFFGLADRIPESALTLLSFVTGIVTVLGWGLKAVAFFLDTKNTQETVANIVTFVNSPTFLVALVCIGVFCFVIVVIKGVGYYRTSRARLFLFSSSFYSATQKLQETTYKIKLRYDQYELSDKQLFAMINSYCDFIINSLCMQLKHITGQEICGCIKLVDGFSDTQTPRAITTETVSDFVRSKNTNDNRINIKVPKKVLIRDNIDFLELMDYNNVRNQFYQPNLIKYAEELANDDKQYRNTTLNWKEYYKSTVVIPIQVSNELLEHQEDEAYNVIGFMCFDSDKEGTFSMELKEPITNLIKAYAALLYGLLDIYGVYLKKVLNKDYIATRVAKQYNMDKTTSE